MNSSILAFSSMFGMSISEVRWDRLNGSVCNSHKTKSELNSASFHIKIEEKVMNQSENIHYRLEDAFEWQAGLLWFLKKVRSLGPSLMCTANKRDINHNFTHYTIIVFNVNYKKMSERTWIGSRNSSGISPRAASASIASEAATLALAPSSENSCIILPSSPILLRTSAAALNNWNRDPNHQITFIQKSTWL